MVDWWLIYVSTSPFRRCPWSPRICPGCHSVPWVLALLKISELVERRHLIHIGWTVDAATAEKVDVWIKLVTKFGLFSSTTWFETNTSNNRVDIFTVHALMHQDHWEINTHEQLCSWKPKVIIWLVSPEMTELEFEQNTAYLSRGGNLLKYIYIGIYKLCWTIAFPVTLDVELWSMFNIINKPRFDLERSVELSALQLQINQI